jgi:hydroxymethylpyrimidine pyrophosphatase-like HAD family hydrolase
VTTKYKILLLDVDGTTVASSGDALPSDRVVSAVQAAQSKLHVALATGRPYELAKPVISRLGLTGLSIVNGGSEIIDVATGALHYQRSMSQGTIQELVRQLIPFGYNIRLSGSNFSPPITSPDSITGPGEQLLVEAVSKNDAPHLIRQISQIKGVARAYVFNPRRDVPVALTSDSWDPGNGVDIHIVQEHATKLYGVKSLLNLLHIDKHEAIAIGDGQNDLPLLEAAGLKVAMGNAPSEVKAIADYIAPSLVEDGVAEAIERFILAPISPISTPPQAG